MLLRATLLVLGTAALAPCQSNRADRFVFRVNGPVTPAQWAVIDGQFDPLVCQTPAFGQPFEVAVTTAQMQAFADLGLDVQLVRVAEPDGGPPTEYYTTAEIEAEIDARVAANPAIARKVDLTTLPGAAVTHNGNSIWALKISDNVGTEEDEPAMVFAAQHHARELNSPHMVIGVMRRIMAAYGTDPAFTQLVDGYELYFVPCVNPDGVNWVWSTEPFWRKNRRDNAGSCEGVDLNRNYGFLWTSGCDGDTTPCSDTYKGPAANSEPENQTMRALMRYLRPDIYIDYHSYGRDVLFLYAPCASVHAEMRTMANFYVNDLRTPINYSTRAPSASGEAPHDHWAEGGTMSLLIEISTDFQPPWSATVSEEVRVWPGIDRVLKTWRPLVSGHVRSILGRQPIEATISYTPDYWLHNEKIQSRPRDGRYVMYAPVNRTYQITYQAPGYQPVTKTVQAGNYNQTTWVDVEMVPIGIAPSTLAKSGSEQVGGTTTLTYDSPGDAGDGYWIALSGGNSPGTPIGTRTIPLNPDPLFFVSATPNAILLNNIGTIPPAETAVATFPIPPIPQLAGLTLYAGGITLNTSYNFFVKKFSSSVAINIQP